MSRMHIEAVTVCVDYSDIFAEAVRHNRHHFDHWMVVTRPDDERTLDLCHAHNMEAVTTRDFHRNGDAFNKGRAIERGLAMLSHRDWVLHLDADIVLPSDFRDSLHDADLDPQGIYGVDRLMVETEQEWHRLRSAGFPRRSHHCYVSMHGGKIGARWADVRYGYVPIGFFQMWHQSSDHRKGIRQRRYPDNHQNAARADVKFALQWDRRNRHLIPEIVVAHLGNDCPTGANWNGRTTKPFFTNGGGGAKPTPIS